MATVQVFSIKIPINEIDKDGFYICEEQRHLKFFKLRITSSYSCCGMGEISNMMKVNPYNAGFERLMHLIKEGYNCNTTKHLKELIIKEHGAKANDDGAYNLFHNFRKGAWILTYVKGDGYNTEAFCEKYKLKKLHSFKNPNSGNTVIINILDHCNLKGYKGEYFPPFDHVQCNKKKIMKEREEEKEKEKEEKERERGKYPKDKIKRISLIFKGMGVF